MIDETTKFNRAKGYYNRVALAGNTDGAFKELVAFNKKADDLKNIMNEKYGPGTVKYGSEIKQPEIKTPQAIFEFSQRNPAAEGGRQGFAENNKLVKKLIPLDKTKLDKANFKRATESVDEFYNTYTKEVVDNAAKEWAEMSNLEPNRTRPIKIQNLDEMENSNDRANFKRKFKEDIKKYGEWTPDRKSKQAQKRYPDGPKTSKSSFETTIFDAFGRKKIKGTNKDNPNYNLKKLDAMKKNLAEYKILKTYLADNFDIITDLDHPLDKATIQTFMNSSSADLTNVNILERNLNTGFKKTLNNKYREAVQAGNVKQKRAVEKIAKQFNLKIGSVPDNQFKTGQVGPFEFNKIDKGVGSFETLDIKKEMLKSLKNASKLDTEWGNYIKDNSDVFKEAGIDTKRLKKPRNVENIANNIDEIEKYITDRTGKVKQPMLSSGLSGAYEMMSDDLKAIVNSDGFKKFANSKAGKTLSMAAKTPGKLFGVGDVLLGYLDYTNNEPMMSKAKAYQSMLQAMSFNLYKGGDRQNLEEIKTKFIENGGDGKIFDQVVDLNKSNFDMMKYIENIKKDYTDLSGVGYEDLAKDRMQSALNNVKKMGEENLNKFEQYKTDLAVSEAGAPIQIKDITQPIKDTKKAAFDLLEEEQIKNYPTTSKQVNTESGPIGNKIFNSILTKDSYKKLLPQNWLSTFNQMIPFMDYKPVTKKEKEQALIDNMEPRERYLYNLARGEDPDNPMTISETANFMDKNKKAIGFAEGGITTLRSKYEYKK
jgi:hypothetical protein